MTVRASSAGAALAEVTAALVSHEDRPGQQRMAEAVADAIDSGRHLVVQAGTGTGKTLAYLIPAILSERRTVVATATKALQDQLATKDLPFVTEQLAQQGVDLQWAVLKGRSNYLCLQRLREFAAPAQEQLQLEPVSHVLRAEVTKLAEWAGQTRSGDVAELEWSPSDAAWRTVSVGSDECPGAERCPMGRECWAELARDRAQVADVVVVNTHLYGIDVSAGGAIIPDHDVVVFDEAHGLEDIMSDTVGVELAPGRFVTLAASVRSILADQDISGSVADLASAAREVLSAHAGRRLHFPLPDEITEFLGEARLVLVRASEALQTIETTVEDAQQRKLRAMALLARTVEYVEAALAEREGTVTFVSGSPDSPRLEIAPLDVGPALRAGVWERRTAILTSATVPTTLASRVGLPTGTTDQVDVGSPFDYATQALLYCAMHLPPPKSPNYRDAVADELVHLIGAAGGRTLALFTSWAALDHAAAAARDRLSVPIITQRELPKPALLAAFAASEETCLFATTGLFQGVDIPGATLSLVVIDKLPFPRPDDPLLSARRELLGAAAFGAIDVPRAATMLAQASGRLIRTAADRGVVAVLDPRLGKARYRWEIVRALPPMRRTRDRAEVEAFLRALRE
ncbi:MAG TPA: ATP-dependent DNA helicase [Ilumatobacter sp.]|nr:ATP-dependent DNA helicase [Ilumatobacter sp.]